MGNAQGLGGDSDGKKKKGDKKDGDNKSSEKPRGPPPRSHGRRRRKARGLAVSLKMPAGTQLFNICVQMYQNKSYHYERVLFFVVAPSSRCALRKLRLERIKDYLLLEEEVSVDTEFVCFLIHYVRIAASL